MTAWPLRRVPPKAPDLKIDSSSTFCVYYGQFFIISYLPLTTLRPLTTLTNACEHLKTQRITLLMKKYEVSLPIPPPPPLSPPPQSRLSRLSLQILAHPDQTYELCLSLLDQ